MHPLRFGCRLPFCRPPLARITLLSPNRFSCCHNLPLSLKAMVDWGNESEAVVCKVWLAKAKRRYTGIISIIKSKRKIPIFMGKDIYNQFEAYWDRPEIKKKAERNSENRHTNISLHRGGSKSFQEHRTSMRKNLKRDPSTFELYIKTHAVQIENEDGTVSYSWNDERAKHFVAEFEKEKNEYLATQLNQTSEEGRRTLTPEEENLIFNKITKLKKQRRYGYGNREILFSGSSSSSSVRDVVELRAKLEEIQTARMEEQDKLAEERARERAELDARLEEERAHMESRVQEMVSRQLALALRNLYDPQASRTSSTG